jgi:hypothetical protein
MAVLIRPHRAAPTNRAAAMESQVIQTIQGVMGQTLMDKSFLVLFSKKELLAFVFSALNLILLYK